MTIISTKEGQEPVVVSKEEPKKKKTPKVKEPVVEVQVEPETTPEPVESDKEDVKLAQKQEKATIKAVQKALREQAILNKAKEEAIIHAREVLATEKQQLKDERKRKREEKKAAKEAIVPENRVKKVKIEEKVEKVEKIEKISKKESDEPPSWFKSYLATQASPVNNPVTTTPPPSPTKPQVTIQQPRPSLVQKRSFDMYSQMFGRVKGGVNI